jgi:hypothetical protein
VQGVIPQAGFEILLASFLFIPAPRSESAILRPPLLHPMENKRAGGMIYWHWYRASP